ncbi:MAG: UbiA family prenyltransferase [Phycisphaerales bacterium JB063]
MDPQTDAHAQPDPDLKRALAINLDGTLVATDTMWESLMVLVGQQPLTLLQAPGWRMRGKCVFQAKVAEHVALDPAALPYRKPVVELARRAYDEGQPVILASACDRSIADAVAAHLGCFTTIVAYDGKARRDGQAKAQQIRDAVAKATDNMSAELGHAFDYVGNTKVDLPVWAEAENAYLVDTPPAVAKQVKPKDSTIELVPPQPGPVPALARAARLHQWVKNLLIVLPLLLAHAAGDLTPWLKLVPAFIAMGLCASAVYLVNDLLDLRSDRLHPTKRRRPLATGELPIPYALKAAPLMVLAAFALSWACGMPGGFLGVLAIYTASAWLYSIAVKGKLMLDVIWLACLYVIRIIAGGQAVGVPTSAWLLAFALFMFLSLAFAKRYSELRLLEDDGKDHAEGRAYFASDQQLVSSMGIASGYMGVLVFALYINSQTVTALYDRPQVLWAICPLLLYWVSRLWGRAHHRTLRDDPLLFALTDRTSYLVIAIVALVAMLAV